MTAIEAAGITKARILRPIFITALIIIGVTIINREFWIPQVKERLVRDARTWKDDAQLEMTVQEDLVSGVVLRGEYLFMDERRVSEADAQLPRSFSSQVPRVIANWAIVEPANDKHPEGLWLRQVAKPDNLMMIPSLATEDGQTLMYTPHDHDWLRPDECFIACHFDVEQMVYGKQLTQFQTTPEMIAELRKPKAIFAGNFRDHPATTFVLYRGDPEQPF